MDLILKSSGGQNVALRPQARPAWYTAGTVDAQEVEVFVQELDPATGAFLGAPIPHGRFPAEGEVVIPHTPDSDRNVIVYAMPYAADNTPGYSDLRHATQATILFRRETGAPVIGQNAPAAVDSVEIGITGFTRFARQRRVTVSSHPDMSDPALVLVFDSEDYVARELPRYLTLSREAGALTTEGGEFLTTEGGDRLKAETTSAALPSTAYVTVAHSGGAGWTPESNVLEVTFAAGDGTGGSDGDFDPTPRDLHTLDTM